MEQSFPHALFIKRNGCILFLISRKKASGCAAGFQTFSFFG